MDSIIEFSHNVTPLALAGILTVIVFMLVRNNDLSNKMRGSPKDGGKSIDLETINEKLNEIARNHLHSLPEMKEAIDRIEIKVGNLGERTSAVEARVDILIKKI